MSFPSWLRGLRSRFGPSRPLRTRQRPPCRPLLDVLEDRTLPTTYVVTTTADSGSGSLRDAINQVNSDHDPRSTIAFNMAASGVQTINLASQLPPIMHPVVIDGTTEAGWVANTSDTLYNANLTVVLDGSGAGTSEALLVAGGNSTIKGLQIQNFAQGGIHILTNGNDTVLGNRIQNTGGGYDSPNDVGFGGGGAVFIDDTALNVVGGNTLDARNELFTNSSSFSFGVHIAGAAADNNQVLGNVIGTDGSAVLASAGLDNFDVLIFNGSDNTIGGTDSSSKNVLVGGGIEIVGYGSEASGNKVQGNFIGTDATGSAALPTPGPNFASFEIGLDGEVSDTLIGGPAGARNVICGGYNGGIGIDANYPIPTSATDSTIIQGNHIGIDVTGTKALGGGSGFSDGVTVNGGTVSIVGNVISGWGSAGISAEGNTSIQGNLIGTDSNGMPGTGGGGLANGTGITAGSGALIGGTTPDTGNTIAYNLGDGILVGGTGVRIEGNSIHDNGGLGIDLTGLGTTLFDTSLPGGPFAGANNASFSGLTLTQTGSTLSYSGTLFGLDNTRYLVHFVFSPDHHNYFSPDYVYLTTDGNGQATFTNLNYPAPQDYLQAYPNTQGPVAEVDALASPPHSLGNYEQNYPVLTAAQSGSTLLVSGSLNSAASTTYTVDVYASPSTVSADFYQGQYYGQGQYYLGTTTVTTDAAGNVNFADDFSAANLPNGVVPAGWYISATSTDPNGNTSEFSADVQAAASAPAFTQAITQSLQSAVNASSTPAVTLQLTPATASAVASAIAAVTVPQNTSATVSLELVPGTYGGQTVTVPAGMTLVIGTASYSGGQQATFDPAQPAFTVVSGNVVVQNVTFVTTGDAPTILVQGGYLTLRNDIIQESTGGNDPAIRVTGGTVDLGTATSPGGNTLNINGTGTFVANTTATPVTAVGDTFTVNNQALTASSLSGFVFVDFNDDGQVDFGEKGLSGVTVTLTGSDDLGDPVNLTQQTDTSGAYLFSNLRPGTYAITETQPAGYLQGIDTVGTSGGSLVATDQFAVPLAPQANGLNYNFGEQPPPGGPVHEGQTAGIGFWNNKKGQALIKALNGGPTSTQLANWLAATLPHMFGVNAWAHNLTGKTNSDVAALFQADFLLKGVRLDAQVLATALNVYVTNATLDPTRAAAAYGFTVSGYGVGTATVNVGCNGDAFGVANGTTMTVLDLLKATDLQAVNGVLYGGNATLRKHANDVFSDLNGEGDD